MSGIKDDTKFIKIEEYNTLLATYQNQGKILVERNKEIEFLKRDNTRLEMRRGALEWALVLAQYLTREDVDKQIEDKFKTTDDTLAIAK